MTSIANYVKNNVYRIYNYYNSYTKITIGILLLAIKCNYNRFTNLESF